MPKGSRKKRKRKLTKTRCNNESLPFAFCSQTRPWQSCYHQSVTIEQKGKEHTYTPDSQELQNDSLLLDGGTDGIAIPSIERAQNPPVYYGTLEIKRQRRGC
ncbi:MAG: hypothetical protein ACLTER_17635 [Ruminococcus sp.]